MAVLASPPPLDALARIAAQFAPATAALQEDRALQRRVDTKYTCDRALVHQILQGLPAHYAALPVPSGNLASYRSLYFDTEDRRCFHDHRRGRRLRHKVRIRHYPDRELTYLEVKTKRNDVVTDKARRKLRFGAEQLGEAERGFLRQHVHFPVEELRPVMRIDFCRLSLVGLHTSERVTIDLDLTAEELDGAHRDFGQLAVFEIKQAPFCVRTPVMRALATSGLREQSMSKYTIATALLHPELRQNRLLPDVRTIERMSK